jgi:hypothetical protein
MARPALEVADIFRDHGPAWRRANAGHVSLDQLKVMSAIESCRTAALGGHVARCEKCAHTHIAYISCRNRHCPKCQGAAAKDWLSPRVISLRALARRPSAKSDDASGTGRLSLLGSAVEMRYVWITSTVIHIDAANGLVQTRNSLYRLGVKAEGEPPPNELITVCAALHRWGLGPLLGAPEFYF